MGSDSASSDSQESPEIIPPSSKQNGESAPSIYAEIAAQINQYTDRPDLLLEVIEKYDPGFIRSMNQEARELSKKSRQARFEFGKFQAYASAIVAIFVAIGILGVVVLLAVLGTLDIWHLIGLAIFYAVTQSGPSGFLKIVSRIVEMIKAATGKGG